VQFCTTILIAATLTVFSAPMAHAEVLRSKSLKGDSFSADSTSIKRGAAFSTIRVTWTTQRGFRSTTIKGFKCGQGAHATLFRSDQPQKYNPKTPEWHSVGDTGATAQLYDFVCD
jgi:hypothetical protein